MKKTTAQSEQLALNVQLLPRTSRAASTSVAVVCQVIGGLQQMRFKAIATFTLVLNYIPNRDLWRL